MGFDLAFWAVCYCSIIGVLLSVLFYGIWRRRSRYPWMKGYYGIDSPNSIFEYLFYTLLFIISPFTATFLIEWLWWDPFHIVGKTMFMILSWSIAFMPGFIVCNILYSSLVTKYDMINRLLHTISQIKLENEQTPINKNSSKTRKGENRRVHKNEFEKKEEFQLLKNPYNIWNGNEKVLDIGCGTGLLTTWIAGKYIRDNIAIKGSINTNLDKNKLDNSGNIIGIDIFNGKLDNQTNNNIEYAIKNCEIENVKEFTKIIKGDCRKLPFENNTFDIVVSSLCIHNIMQRNNSANGQKQRKIAIKEAIRVLKPGGILAIYDVFISEEYIKVLLDHPDIRSIDQSHELPGFYQAHIITACKV